MAEIIFLAIIAVIIFFKLNSVLGTRTGHEGKNNPWFEDKSTVEEGLGGLNEDINVINLNENQVTRVNYITTELSAKDNEALEDFKKIDPNFDVFSFLEGACRAFEMVIDAFNKKKLDVLKKLMQNDLYEAFKTNLSSITPNTQLVSFLEVKIESMQLNKKHGFIEVSYLTEQIIDNGPVEEVIDKWTLTKNLANKKDPSWLLIRTDS